MKGVSFISNGAVICGHAVVGGGFKEEDITYVHRAAYVSGTLRLVGGFWDQDDLMYQRLVEEKNMNIITIAEDIITAGEKQGIDLVEAEAILILEYMNAYDYALAMNEDGQTELYNLQTDSAEGTYTIRDAVEFCILQNENLINEAKNGLFAYEDDGYLPKLLVEEIVLKGILRKFEKNFDTPQTLCMETPLGTIVVNKSTEKEYPSVWIDLQRPNAPVDMPIALVEVCSDEGDIPDGEKHLITRVWRDAKDECYTDRIVHTGIDEFFEEN